MERTVTVVLNDSNNQPLKVVPELPPLTEGMARQCLLVVDMAFDGDGFFDDLKEVPLDLGAEVKAESMRKALEFLKYHENNPVKKVAKPLSTTSMEELVGKWDADFFDLEDDQDRLVDLIMIGNYLNCAGLVDTGMLKFATMIKDKEPDAIKKLLGIEYTLSEEEEKQVRDDNPWIFELGLKNEANN